MKPQMSLKMGHVWSKTRSLGKILNKPFVCSRAHIFSPIFMKLVRKVVLTPLTNDWTELKALIASDRLIQVKIKISVFERVENIVGKGENA